MRTSRQRQAGPQHYQERSPSIYDAAMPSPAATAGRPPAISVIGLGQAGVVAVGCLAHLGFPVVGVDIRAERNAGMLDGNAPVPEARLERLLLDGVRGGRIRASQNLITAVMETDVTLMTAGADASIEADLDQTSRAIGQALALKHGYHVVVLAGDAPHGCLETVVRPVLERASAKRLGADFGLACMPRLGHPGMTVIDFFASSRTLVGASDLRAAAAVAGIVQLVDADAIFTTIEVAEMVHRADRLWQATRAAFDQEVGRLCHALAVDGDEVMDLFRRGVRANSPPSEIGPARARASASDARQLRAVARLGCERGIELPLIESLLARST